jgi:nucleotide-binding universal stress UspA family protein
MFKKLLLPLDLTDRHQAVLDIAADLARLHGGDVTLLHVIETIPGLAVEEEKTFFKNLEKTADNHLERYRKVLEQRGVPCRHKVLLGHRAARIVEYAGQTGADLILVAAPQFDPTNPAAGWASLSHKLAFVAQCPVLLVKLPAGGKP